MAMNNRFDQKARAMDEHPVIREIALHFSEALKKAVPFSEKMHVLDFGCGSGLVSMHLYQEVGSLVMMDSSTGMLEILQEKIAQHGVTNMQVVNSSVLESLPDAESFDVIFMNNVLHHIDDVTGFLGALCRKLKPGGHLCLGDLKKEDGTFHEDNTGVKHFGFEVLKLGPVLKASGLTDLRWEDYFVVTKPRGDNSVRDYPLFFVAACKA